jgi:hypothetical protein
MEIGLYFPYFFLKGMPHMLDGVQTWAIKWPINRPNFMLFKLFRRTAHNMHSSIILNKHIPRFVIRKQTFLQNVTIEPGTHSYVRSFRIPSASHQFRSPFFINSLLHHSPHHNRNSRPSMILRIHEILPKPFGRQPEDPLTRVLGRIPDGAFVGKQASHKLL